MYLELVNENRIVIIFNNENFQPEKFSKFLDIISKRNIKKIHILISSRIFLYSRFLIYVRKILKMWNKKIYIHCVKDSFIYKELKNNIITESMLVPYNKPIYFKISDDLYRKFTIGNRCGIFVDDVKKVGD